jgi:TetR/AcrR family transcriptional regulator
MPVAESKAGKAGSRGEPEKTRAAILHAALEEFAHEGVAGARTDEIARNAGVNKALLYYYFKDKDGLYAAVLEQIFGGLSAKVAAVLDREDLSPREKLLLYAETHFDYMGNSPLFPRVLQREFMRTGRNATALVGRIVEHYARPLYSKMTQLIAEGCETGDFRPCDPQQTLTSILGVVVFYFISIPAQQLMAAGDPFSPERLAARRAAVLDFISAAVFSDSAAKGNAKPVLATGLNRDNNSLRRKGKSK